MVHNCIAHKVSRLQVGYVPKIYELASQKVALFHGSSIMKVDHI